MKEALRELAAAMARADSSASFAFELWDGDRISAGNGLPAAILRINTPDAVRKMFAGGFHGFGDAYVSGEIEVEGDLQELLRLGLAIQFDENTQSFWRKIRFLPFYLKTRSLPKQARNNIEYHYGRSNDFYALFLDETLTYSCAYFRNKTDSLEQAQRNKFEHVARKLMLAPGETLLDVGCGWGGMLLHCAGRFGIKGVGNTLSHNQFEFAAAKAQRLGLKDRVQVLLQDYRELSGVFDKFVSIGMFEHVGKEFIPGYLEKVAGLLKKGGLGLLHTIAKDVDTPTDTWTLQNIFPGGYIPNLAETVQEMGRVGFCILDIENLRLHYARTIDHWIARFEKSADKVMELFGERFVRMWRLYLHSSRAGFKYDGTRVYQILFSNGLRNDLPMVRDYMYSREQ